MWPGWLRRFVRRSDEACGFAIRTIWFAKPQVADSSRMFKSITNVGRGVAADHQRDGRQRKRELK
jgi:hypothetical protein